MSRTLTEIRKGIDHDTCADVRSLCDILRRIAEHNPEALRAAVIGKYTFGKRAMTEGQIEGMVALTLDKIDYTSQTFNNK